ncbi:MAG: DNA-binding protein [Salinarimonadaceae bacterium]|nr:MAG: DNA-binding protein [Salinarimonadaceae bacterium]
MPTRCSNSPTAQSARRSPMSDIARILLTMHEAASMIGVCERTLRDHVRDGALRYILVGRGVKRQRRMFDPADIDAFVEAQRRTECRLTDQRAGRSTSTISSCEVIDFTGRRAARTNATPTSSKRTAGKKPSQKSRRRRG